MESCPLYVHIYIFVGRCFFKNFSHSLIKYELSIWFIDGTLTNTSHPSHRGPGRNDNKGVFHILQIKRIGASPSDTVEYHTKENPFMCGIQSAYFEPPLTGLVSEKFWKRLFGFFQKNSLIDWMTFIYVFIYTSGHIVSDHPQKWRKRYCLQFLN